MQTQEAVLEQKREVKRAVRLYYLDWLRLIAIVGVWAYHSARPFMLQDWLINNTEKSDIITFIFLIFLGSIGMPLFFMMAGAGSLFALRHRTGRRFAAERTSRLLVPFFVGCILLSPVQFYLEWLHKGWYEGSFLKFLPVLAQDRLDRLLTFSPSIFEALGSHLWFLGYLFSFSLIALPLFLWLKSGPGQRALAWLGKLGERRGGLLLFVLPIATVRMSLQPFFPGYTDWSDFGYMLIYFLLGYLLFADERLVRAVRRDWRLMLGAGVISTLIMLLGLTVLDGQEWVKDPSTPGFYLCWGLVGVNGWSWTLFALWLGMRFFDFRNRWLERGQELIVPFYVFHQPPIVVIAFLAVQWPVGLLVKLAVIVVGSFAVTVGMCEGIVRRIKPARALFGMKPAPALSPKPRATATGK